MQSFTTLVDLLLEKHKYYVVNGLKTPTQSFHSRSAAVFGSM